MLKPFRSNHVELTNRRLAFLAIHATGFNPEVDRIVEVAVLMRSPFSPDRRFRRLVDPSMRILAEATAAHGITDLAVAEAETFEEVGPKLEGFLGAADLAGFGIRRLAIPLLAAEFRRAGVHFGWIGRRVVDLREIYLHHHPHDLGAASRHYLDRELPAQPGAMDEAESSSALLDAQIIRHEEMPTHVAELAAFPHRTDHAGLFRRRPEGPPVFARGLYLGRTAAEVAGLAPDYLKSLLGPARISDTEMIIEDALVGIAAIPPIFRDQRASR